MGLEEKKITMRRKIWTAVRRVLFLGVVLFLVVMIGGLYINVFCKRPKVKVYNRKIR